MSKRFIEKRYIEVVGEITTAYIDLSLWNVFCIGKFTRENVHDWFAGYLCRTRMMGDDWFVDFHAVCGQQEIPWATEEARDLYARCVERERRANTQRTAQTTASP